MMGRIIYKGRSVSHIYLWVAIAFWELSAATHPQAKTAESDNPRNGTIAIKKRSHRGHFAAGRRGFRKLL
jgi:hypothetical protein